MDALTVEMMLVDAPQTWVLDNEFDRWHIACLHKWASGLLDVRELLYAAVEVDECTPARQHGCYRCRQNADLLPRDPRGCW